MTTRSPHNLHAGRRPGDPASHTAIIRAALGRAFLAALADDFAREGKRTIITLRERHPHDYLRLVGALLLRELSVKEVDLPDMSEAKLDTLLSVVRELTAEKEKEQRGEGVAAAQETGATRD